jgi:hypothetical protein
MQAEKESYIIEHLLSFKSNYIDTNSKSSLLNFSELLDALRLVPETPPVDTICKILFQNAVLNHDLIQNFIASAFLYNINYILH